MFYEIFEHGVTYVRVGCADNVWATCNGHGQGERVTASPSSRVYAAGRARRDIGGARGD